MQTFDQGSICLAHCNECHNSTSHTVLGSKLNEYRDEDGYLEDSRTWAMVECCGCGEIKLLVAHRDAFSMDASEKQHPPASRRRPPEWYDSIVLSDPKHAFVLNMLKEIYGAWDNGFVRLVAAGIRSLIEQVAIEQGGDGGTFRANLLQLEEAGHLSRLGREKLAKVVDAGSAAIHRGYVPDFNDVSTMLDLVEHLIASVYVHGARVAALAARTPPRKRG